MIGQTIAHYEITGKIGAGGMGEVFRARDKKLNRDVALKFLPDAYVSDSQRMGRFQREAQLLASLNHPNIASIYGVEEERGQRALVLELVEGEDLSEVLSARTISVDEAMEIAAQIAEALESAHEKGVIHRDLKPANVKITPDGQVKVLDFGLAKALSGEGDSSEMSPVESPTLTAAATSAGMVLGTAAYMSPEQARGMNVDRRADIWSFGIVLFEMLARKPLYAGETVSDTLAAVIKDEPHWNLLPADSPQPVVDLLHRCLQKDPRRRLQSIGEARIALEDLIRPHTESMAPSTLASGAVMPSALAAATSSMADSGVQAAPDSTRSSPRLIAAWIASLIVVAVLATLGGRLLSQGSPELRTRQFYIEPEGLVVQYPTQPVLSPDGRHVAYFAGPSLWIRDLDRLTSVEVPNTSSASSPFWSPDGDWLAFGQDNRIYKVPAAGGIPAAVCDVPFVALDGATWDEADMLHLAPNSGPIYTVSARGGDPRELFPQGVGEGDYHTPSALPGGKAILFTTHRTDGRDTIEVLANGERKIILRIPGARLEYACWMPLRGSKSSGHLVYHRMNTNSGIWAVPFDLGSLEVTGEPFILDPNGAFPSVAKDGSLLYAVGSGGGNQQLVTVTRAGEITGSIGQPQPGMIWPSVSPDASAVLISAMESDSRDIWLHDVERGTRTRLTFGTETDWKAYWLNDNTIAFTNGSSANNMTYRKPADGSREPELLVEGYHVTLGGGEWMAFNRFDTTNGDGIFYLPIDGGGEPQVFLQTNANELGPWLSPDGNYIVYMSNESGGNEVYLTSFPGGEGKWQVSTTGGAWPVWSRAGDEIIYREGAGAGATLMSVSVQTSPSIRLGSPVRLFGSEDVPTVNFGSGMRGYDTTPDPNVFVMLAYVGDESLRNTRLVYSENWYEAYRRESE